MRRFKLSELAQLPASELSSAFRHRITHHRSELNQSMHLYPQALDKCCFYLQRGWTLAASSTTESGSLKHIEESVSSATAELRNHPAAVRESLPGQQLLRTTFAALIGQRALLQAAHGDPVWRREHTILPVRRLPGVILETVEDTRAFCREKHGDSPECRILPVRARGPAFAEGDSPEMETEREGTAVFLAPFVVFALHEILKNAMGAHVRAVGADELSRLPPIDIRYGSLHGHAFVGVSDCGGGWRKEPGDAIKFLCTDNPDREPNYTYSRDFGSPFEGLGMGLPLASMHASYCGGALYLNAVRGSGARPAGTHAGFTFDVSGAHREPMVRHADMDHPARDHT